MATTAKKAPARKATAKKAPARKATAKKAPAKKAPVKKAATKTKVEQAMEIVKAEFAANKDAKPKDVIARIAEKMGCEVKRAQGHYYAARKRIKEATK